MIFVSKDINDILSYIVNNKVNNRYLLLAIYNYHRDIFDEFISTLSKIPFFSIEHNLFLLQQSTGMRFFTKRLSDIYIVIKLFKILGFDTSKAKYILTLLPCQKDYFVEIIILDTELLNNYIKLINKEELWTMK